MLRVAFIGTGGIAGRYLRTLARQRDAGVATLAAACDLVADRAAQAAAPFGAATFTDWRRLLDAERYDAVFVCVPPFAHEGQEEAAAGAGSHLFVAKPVALHTDYARGVIEAVSRTGVVASSGYMWRHNGCNEQVQALLAGREVSLVLGSYLSNLPGTPWWRLKAQSGGQMVEQTTHIFDLARYFAGEVEEVSAAGCLRALADVPRMATEDASACVLRFASGAVGNIVSCCAAQRGSDRVDLEVFARGVTVRYDCNRGFSAWGARQSTEVQYANDPYDEVVTTFLEAARTRQPALLRSPYADAARTLAVTEAAERSLQAGGRATHVEAVGG